MTQSYMTEVLCVNVREVCTCNSTRIYLEHGICRKKKGMRGNRVLHRLKEIFLPCTKARIWYTKKEFNTIILSSSLNDTLMTPSSRLINTCMKPPYS